MEIAGVIASSVFPGAQAIDDSIITVSVLNKSCTRTLQFSELNVLLIDAGQLVFL